MGKEQTPFSLIFDKIERSCRSLHFQTALLEASDWDEEVCQDLVEAVAVKLEELGRDPSQLAGRDVGLLLRKQLGEVATDRQIDTVMEMFRDEMNQLVQIMFPTAINGDCDA